MYFEEMCVSIVFALIKTKDSVFNLKKMSF